MPSEDGLGAYFQVDEHIMVLTCTTVECTWTKSATEFSFAVGPRYAVAMHLTEDWAGLCSVSQSRYNRNLLSPISNIKFQFQAVRENSPSLLKPSIQKSVAKVSYFFWEFFFFFQWNKSKVTLTVLCTLRTKGGFLSESAIRFSNLQKKYSKSLS